MCFADRGAKIVTNSPSRIVNLNDKENRSEEKSFVVPPGSVLSFSLEGSDHVGTRPECFAFVMNVVNIVGADNITLLPGYELRRATSLEIEKIKNSLMVSGEGLLGLRDFPWEYNRGADSKAIHLPASEQRYFVIAFQEFSQKDLFLQYALTIARLELEIAFIAGPAPTVPGRAYPCTIHNPGRLFRKLDEFRRGLMPLLCVEQNDANDIADICDALQSHDPEVINFQRIASQLLEFETLPRYSQAKFLAYFGILESLLTHRPDPKDPYDSITRQVKKKLALLDNRWSPQLDYIAFGNVKAETLWAKMYAYRSCLAHGDVPDFKSGELVPLAGPDKAMHLLKSTVKAVIQLALREPRLIADLKDC